MQKCKKFCKSRSSSSSSNRLGFLNVRYLAVADREEFQSAARVKLRWSQVSEWDWERERCYKWARVCVALKWPVIEYSKEGVCEACTTCHPRGHCTGLLLNLTDSPSCCSPDCLPPPPSKQLTTTSQSSKTHLHNRPPAGPNCSSIVLINAPTLSCL